MICKIFFASNPQYSRKVQQKKKKLAIPKHFPLKANVKEAQTGILHNKTLSNFNVISQQWVPFLKQTLVVEQHLSNRHNVIKNQVCLSYDCLWNESPKVIYSKLTLYPSLATNPDTKDHNKSLFIYTVYN